MAETMSRRGKAGQPLCDFGTVFTPENRGGAVFPLNQSVPAIQDDLRTWPNRKSSQNFHAVALPSRNFVAVFLPAPAPGNV